VVVRPEGVSRLRDLPPIVKNIMRPDGDRP
jgi:hypothetical protein